MGEISPCTEGKAAITQSYKLTRAGCDVYKKARANRLAVVTRVQERSDATVLDKESVPHMWPSAPWPVCVAGCADVT